MSWQHRFTDMVADVLRLLARLGLLVCTIIIVSFLVWLTWKSCWKLGDWLTDWLFT